MSYAFEMLNLSENCASSGKYTAVAELLQGNQLVIRGMPDTDTIANALYYAMPQP